MYLGDAESQITDDGIRHIMRAIQRFHYAAKQDVNPLVAALHNGYTYVLISNLLELTKNGQVQAATGEDPEGLKQEIYFLRDKLEGQMIRLMEKMSKKGITIDELIKRL